MWDVASIRRHFYNIKNPSFSSLSPSVALSLSVLFCLALCVSVSVSLSLSLCLSLTLPTSLALPPPPPFFFLSLFLSVFVSLCRHCLPVSKCLTQQKPGRLVRARQQPHYVPTSTIGDYIINNSRAYIINNSRAYIINNSRAYIIPSCRADRPQNSLFVKTAADWNHLDNAAVRATSAQRFEALSAVTQHQ